MKLSERIINKIPDYLTADNVRRETEGVTTQRNTVLFQADFPTGPRIISVEENRKLRRRRYTLTIVAGRPLHFDNLQALCEWIESLIVKQVRHNEK